MKKTVAILFIAFVFMQCRAYCQVDRNDPATLFQSVKVQFHKKMLDTAMANVAYLLAKLNPDITTRNEARQLAQAMYDTLLNEAERKLNDRYIAESVAKYEKAAGFCKSVDGLVCSTRGADGLKLAKNDLYADIVVKAKTEMENGNLTDAETLANKAAAYALQNAEAIKNADEANNVLIGIREKHYKRYIMKVKADIGAKHYYTALAHLQEADDYLKNNGLKRDAQYYQQLKVASRPVIANLIEKANSNKSDIATARKFFYSADSLARQSGLNEGHLKDELEALGKEVENNDCMNWQVVFKDIISKAKSMKEDRSFLRALETYTYAVSKKDSVAGCYIDVSEAESEIKELKPAADYQYLMTASAEAEKNNRFADAIKEYDSAENILIKDSLTKYNLVKKNTYNYVLEHTDPAFLEAGAGYFSEINIPGNALNLLSEALKNGYQPAAKDLQHTIGVQLAEADYKANPDANPKKLAEQYCGDNEKLNILKKAYLKTWKGLK